MKKFTFEDYRKALKGCSLSMARNILERAIDDNNIDTVEFARLCDLVYLRCSDPDDAV